MSENDGAIPLTVRVFRRIRSALTRWIVNVWHMDVRARCKEVKLLSQWLQCAFQFPHQVYLKADQGTDEAEGDEQREFLREEVKEEENKGRDSEDSSTKTVNMSAKESGFPSNERQIKII